MEADVVDVETAGQRSKQVKFFVDLGCKISSVDDVILEVYSLTD